MARRDRIHTTIALVALLGAGGCAGVDEVKDKVEGVTNRFVLEGLYLGIAEPDDPQLQDMLSGTDYDKATTLKVFLADAGDVTEIQNAPISGADVSFLSDANGGSIALVESSAGSYSLPDGSGVVYTAGETVSVSADYGGTTHKAPVDAPAAADAGIDTSHTAGTAMVVDLSAQDFDSALVVVVDANGQVTYSNEPTSIEDLYNFTHSGTWSGKISIPAKAFPDETLYAVGVSGLYIADPNEFTEVNTALSTLMAGKLKFSPVCTIPNAGSSCGG